LDLSGEVLLGGADGAVALEEPGAPGRPLPVGLIAVFAPPVFGPPKIGVLVALKASPFNWNLTFSVTANFFSKPKTSCGA
jgi:hypothetical protein